MIGSFFKDSPPIPEPEKEAASISEDLAFQTNSEESLIVSLQTVHKIVNRKHFLNWASEAADLVQGIALRLLKWRHKYREQSAKMSPNEWQSFAAQTTYNEINRYFVKNQRINVVPIEVAEEITSKELIEGTSEAEVFSLALYLWQEICGLSLRQRRALLLANQELIINFLTCGIADHEIAEILNLTMEEWENTKEKLPLKDCQIAEFAKKEGNKNSIGLITNSIKKARFEAREKLRRLTDK